MQRKLIKNRFDFKQKNKKIKKNERAVQVCLISILPNVKIASEKRLSNFSLWFLTGNMV